MWLADRLFGTRSPTVPLDLAGLRVRFAVAVTRCGPADPYLTRARIADGFRAAGMSPATPKEFDLAAAKLDGESWRRLAVLATAWDVEPFRAALPLLTADSPVTKVVTDGFITVASSAPLLTLDVLSRSEPRVEEFARRFVTGLRAIVEGETAAESKQRLDKLDYARLLAEADKAKAAATKRAEKLKKLQDEQEERRAPRGKW